MRDYLLIALGSGLGGCARHALAAVVGERAGGSHWGTLAVNLLGSAAIGVLAVWLREARGGPAWNLAVVGFLGGFTTFSAFALQTLEMLQGGRIGPALANAALSLVGCVLGAWAGWMLAGLARPAV